MHRHRAVTCLLAALLAACDDAPCSTDDDCFRGEVCREDGKCRKAVAQDMSSPDLDMMDLGSPREDMTTSPDMPEPDLPDPCASFMCAPGTCDPTDRAPICSCPEGYSAAADPKRCAPVPTAVAAGAQHTCAIAGGKLSCWGDNTRGQLGVGDLDPRDRPTAVAGMTSGVTAVAAGTRHTCAIQGGKLYCWGDHTEGQVGKGSAGALLYSLPALIRESPATTHITAGALHTCSIAAGKLYCWGDNAYGRLGTGERGGRLPTATLIAPELTFSHVSAGEQHTCAISSGQAKCWGAGASGRLGNMDPTYTDQLRPVDVRSNTVDVANTTDIAAGGKHTCAIARGGGLSCWGLNALDQLGNTRVMPGGTSEPAAVLADSVTHIAAGESHTCAIQGGTIYCWGANSYGQGGQGSISTSLALPNIVTNPTNPDAISAGALHTCAIAAGALYCWGANAKGQLGTGSPNDALTPALIALP
jgi:alpha-tubulin suppressor-like RCC1 family protein